MKNRKIITRILYFTLFLFIPSVVFCGSPVFTLTALTPTSIQLLRTSTATIQYLVENQSNIAHTLIMQPITGITQITSAGNCPNPFTLAAKQSCTLTIQVNGAEIVNPTYGGPFICQQGPDGNPNPMLCYQPNAANILNITIENIYVGTQNGNVYYSTNGGSSWTATTSPASGSAVNSIFATASTLYAGIANGYIYYSSNTGYSWTNTSQPDGSAVNSVFLLTNTLYAGTANGNVCYSANNGNSWNITSQPDGSAVNSIFVTTNAIYAGTANGNVYYSTNNGAIWTAINGQPDGSSIKKIFVSSNTLYVDTGNEYVYTSPALTGGGTWTTFAQTVYSLFVNPIDNTVYAGTQSGYVYSLSNGNVLGFVTYSPINSIYVVN